MRFFFFSLLVFILMVSGIKHLQANVLKDNDFNFQSSVENKSSVNRKIKIFGKALKPENILVKEGDNITAGQPLISRQLEIDTLNSQKSKIEEKINFISNQKIVKPIEPIDREYPKLPPVNFDAELLKISAIQARCNKISSDLDEVKNAELPYSSNAVIDKLEKLKQYKSRELNQAKDLLNNLRSLNFDSHYIYHQEEVIKNITQEIQEIDSDILIELGKIQEKLFLAKISRANTINDLENKLSDCKRELQISEANLVEAKYQRQILEQNYERSLATYLQEQDRNKQIYQRDMISYNEAVERQKLALFEANVALDQIKLKLSEITEVKAPYAGKISKIKIVDSVDGYVNVEFTLLY